MLPASSASRAAKTGSLPPSIWRKAAISASVSSVLKACQREKESLSCLARKNWSSAFCCTESVIGAEKPRLSDTEGRSETPEKRTVCRRLRIWMMPPSTVAPSTAAQPTGLPPAPIRPKASGICISRLRLSDGVGGTDCSISSVNVFAAAL